AIPGIEVGRLEAEEKQPGTYVLERAAPGARYVLASAPGCAEIRADVELPSDEPVVLHLRTGGRIAGKGLAPGGAPIARSELEVLAGPGPRDREPAPRSDADGRFALDSLLEGEFVIGIQADGFAATR